MKVKYDYDKEKKILTLDCEGTLIISKNEYGMFLTKEFVDNTDFKVEVKNHYTIGNCIKVKGFKTKFRQSVMALKYIWK
jgi:hypothetical protein